jgi:hypothetical protein
MSQLAAHESYAYDGQYHVWKIQQYNCMLSLVFIIVLAADRSKMRQDVGNSNNGCHATGGHLQKRKMKREKMRKKRMPTRMRTITEGVHQQVIKTEYQQCATWWVSAISLERGLLALQDQSLAAIYHISSYPTMALIIQPPRLRASCPKGKAFLLLELTRPSHLCFTSS